MKSGFEHRVHILPGWLSSKESISQYRRHGRRGFDSWVRKIPQKRKWQPALVFLPGKLHGQRSLRGYSPWGHKESDSTEHTHMHVLGGKGEGVKTLNSGKRAHQRESPSHCISLPVGFKGWRLPPGSSGDACANRGAETMGAGLRLVQIPDPVTLSLYVAGQGWGTRLCASPRFSNLNVHTNHKDVIKMQICIQQVWGKALDFEFLTVSWVMLIPAGPGTTFGETRHYRTLPLRLHLPDPSQFWNESSLHHHLSGGSIVSEGHLRKVTQGKVSLVNPLQYSCLENPMDRGAWGATSMGSQRVG